MVLGGGTVVVVDDRTNHLVKTIPVGREVEDLALDPSGQTLYAASSVVSRLSVINTATLGVVAVQTLPCCPIEDFVKVMSELPR